MMQLPGFALNAIAQTFDSSLSLQIQLRPQTYLVFVRPPRARHIQFSNNEKKLGRFETTERRM
jgi:hypothetical protein